jgi:hypothetical protein
VEIREIPLSIETVEDEKSRVRWNNGAVFGVTKATEDLTTRAATRSGPAMVNIMVKKGWIVNDLRFFCFTR